jgi:hypothetical protein
MRSWIVAGIVVGMFLCIGCSLVSSRIPVASYSARFKVQVYEHGQDSPARTIEAGSTEERLVRDWLTEHDRGWTPSLVTFVPYKTIKSEHFELNFHTNRCVLNDDDRVRQLVLTLEPGDSPPDVFRR